MGRIKTNGTIKKGAPKSACGTRGISQKNGPWADLKEGQKFTRDEMGKSLGDRQNITYTGQGIWEAIYS